MQAYDTFENAMQEQALKVIITNGVMFNEVKRASDSFGNVILEGQSLKEQLIVNDSPGG
jgi:hypothetical protein